MSSTLKAKISGITPFVALIIFFSVGFYLDKWQYAWIAFLLIPIVPMMLYAQKLTLSFTVLIVLVYVIIGVTTQTWHPTWIMLFLIPIFSILFPGKKLYLWESHSHRKRREAKDKAGNYKERVREFFEAEVEDHDKEDK